MRLVRTIRGDLFCRGARPNDIWGGRNLCHHVGSAGYVYDETYAWADGDDNFSRFVSQHLMRRHKPKKIFYHRGRIHVYDRD